jgi:hypothetical protein
MFLGIYSSFHFATLNEYYVGTLHLPVCNGVSDGSVAIIVFMIITGFIGPGIWATPIVNGEWF